MRMPNALDISKLENCFYYGSTQSLCIINFFIEPNQSVILHTLFSHTWQHYFGVQCHCAVFSRTECEEHKIIPNLVTPSNQKHIQQ